MKEICILIADDHPLMREALCIGIKNVPGMRVVGEAADGREAVRLATLGQPDIILLDLYMPAMDGMKVLDEINRLKQDCKVIILTSSHDDENVQKAVRKGAYGYLLKDFPRETVLECIRTVASGEKYFPERVVEIMVNGSHMQSERAACLTKREEQILTLIGEGLANQEIADKLNLSRSTIRVHIHNILRKLRLQNRWQVMQYAIKKRLSEEGKNL